jgi:hypothetical protein
MQFPDSVGQTVQSQLHPSLAAFLLQYEKDIDDYIHYLRGEFPRVDAKTDEVTWEPPEQNAAGDYILGREPVLNEQGVYEVQRYLKSLTSKIITVSQVDDYQWREDLLSNCLTVYSALFLNYRRYGLKPNKYELLCCEMTNMIEFALSKSKNKMMSELIHPKYTSQEHVFVQKNAEQKTGMFGLLGK